jgi:hypothetical protein
VVLAQLDSDVQTLWWITLAVGLVVAVVVTVLLHVLLRTVKSIEENVVELWQTATTVARNTATSWLLGDTAAVIEEIKEEALRHDRLLGGDGGGP